MSTADEIYRRSPGWLQTVLLNAYAVGIQRERYGSPFKALQADWDRSERWTPEQLRSMQDERVRDLVRFAYETVPFYRRRYDEHGVTPADVRGVDDLRRLPLITKADVRAHEAEMLAAPAAQLVHGHTSGTTGTPLGLYYDKPMCVANAVADWRQKRWAGMTSADWCGMFLGRVVVPIPRTEPPFWRANYVHRQLWFSSFHMTDEHLERYVAEIRARGLRYLEGYPSTLFIVARYLARRGERLPMAAVFTSSETLHAVQRETIEAAFDCRVFDFYGMAERVLFAGECERGEGKHLFDEYGVTEIVDEAGVPVPDGQTGWLVGTSLWNRGMPLIRYRTSDLSSRLPGACGCGRGLGRVANVATKAEDIVVTPDGRMISPSVLTHPFKPFPQLLKSQIIQDAADHVHVKLVPSQDFSDAHRAKLVALMAERLGPGVRITTETVDDIPREKSGKFRWVISRVPHDAVVRWDA